MILVAERNSVAGTLRYASKIGPAAPHSKTLRDCGGRIYFRQVLECGGAPPLSEHQLRTHRLPVITVLLVALATIIYFQPAAASELVYDRNQIVSGEVWRLITCNFVHFSQSHFLYDLLAFGLAGSLIELHRHRGFAPFCLLSPLVIGVTVFLLQPELEVFGGLSGMATGAIVFLAFHGLHEHGPWRWICLLALVVIGVKIGVEFATGELLFAQSDSILIKPVPMSHIAGALAAATARH